MPLPGSPDTVRGIKTEPTYTATDSAWVEDREFTGQALTNLTIAPADSVPEGASIERTSPRIRGPATSPGTSAPSQEELHAYGLNAPRDTREVKTSAPLLAAVAKPGEGKLNKSKHGARIRAPRPCRGRGTPPPPEGPSVANRLKAATSRRTQKAEEEITPPTFGSSDAISPRDVDAQVRQGHKSARLQPTRKGGAAYKPCQHTEPNRPGRRSSNRDRVAPIAFWTLDGLGRCRYWP